jgi:hypothetical protein
MDWEEHTSVKAMMLNACRFSTHIPSIADSSTMLLDLDTQVSISFSESFGLPGSTKRIAATTIACRTTVRQGSCSWL